MVEVMKLRNKFWNWIKNEESGERVLRLEGTIAEDSWFEDDVTPKQFRDELNSGEGDISVWINSYGGDVFAAAQIYTMLKDYPHKVKTQIEGIAASAASVIAMAGDEVLISPVGAIMIHNPAMEIFGDSDEIKTAIRVLDEIKETIINAYELKTKLPREKISKLMDAKTWFNAKKALELGFVDKILFTDDNVENAADAVIFSRMTVINCLLNKIRSKTKKIVPVKKAVKEYYNRLNLITH